MASYSTDQSLTGAVINFLSFECLMGRATAVRFFKGMHIEQ